MAALHGPRCDPEVQEGGPGDGEVGAVSCSTGAHTLLCLCARPQGLHGASTSAHRHTQQVQISPCC